MTTSHFFQRATSSLFSLSLGMTLLLVGCEDRKAPEIQPTKKKADVNAGDQYKKSGDTSGEENGKGAGGSGGGGGGEEESNAGNKSAGGGAAGGGGSGDKSTPTPAAPGGTDTKVDIKVGIGGTPDTSGSAGGSTTTTGNTDLSEVIDWDGMTDRGNDLWQVAQ